MDDDGDDASLWDEQGSKHDKSSVKCRGKTVLYGQHALTAHTVRKF